MFKQKIVPNLTYDGTNGFSLAHVARCFGVVKPYPSATEAFQDTKYRHPAEEALPNAYVPVWFEVDGNPFGHVMIWDPQEKALFGTTAQGGVNYVELGRMANSTNNKCLGWTEDIGEIRVVEWSE